MPTYIGDKIDEGIEECKKGSFIQSFWCPTGVLVVTEGGDELVENNTDSGIIEIFIEELYGSDLVERDLAIGPVVIITRLVSFLWAR